jgi:hypothetical protein
MPRWRHSTGGALRPSCGRRRSVCSPTVYVLRYSVLRLECAWSPTATARYPAATDVMRSRRRAGRRRPAVPSVRSRAGPGRVPRTQSLRLSLTLPSSPRTGRLLLRWRCSPPAPALSLISIPSSTLHRRQTPTRTRPCPRRHRSHRVSFIPTSTSSGPASSSCQAPRPPRTPQQH